MAAGQPLWPVLEIGWWAAQFESCGGVACDVYFVMRISMSMSMSWSVASEAYSIVVGREQAMVGATGQRRLRGAVMCGAAVSVLQSERAL